MQASAAAADPAARPDASSAPGAPRARAQMQSRGWYLGRRLLDEAGAGALAAGVERAAELGPRMIGAGGAARAVALLASSDAAAALLDSGELREALAELFPDELILSRADGVLLGPGAAAGWRRDLGRVRRDVRGAGFRPGLSLWVPLDGAGTLEVARAGHRMGDEPREAALLATDRLAVERGQLAALEGGAWHRALGATRWVHLVLVRAWIKPEVWFPSALGPERMAKLGPRARALCAAEVGLPTTVEEFLAIEEAALSSPVGHAKGSGI